MTSDMTSDREGLEVIAIVAGALASLIVAGWAATGWGGFVWIWLGIAVSACSALAGAIRSVRLIRMRRARRGLPIAGLVMCLAILVVEATWSLLVVFAEFTFRNYRF